MTNQLILNNIEKESMIITPLYFIFLSKNDVEGLLDGLEDADDKYKKIAEILSEFYGKCDEEQLKLNLEN